MMNNIISDIICTEFEKVFKNHKEFTYGSDPDNGMLLTFKLKPEYDVENGYRFLDIFIFGGGSNYISVVARLRWTVIRNEWMDGDDGLLPGKDYIEGQTPWVYQSHHDSCWREDGVRRLLWNFRDRILVLDNKSFDDWYTVQPIGDKDTWRDLRNSHYNSRDRKELKDLEFFFEKEV